jgi:hypothetical protein
MQAAFLRPDNNTYIHMFMNKQSQMLGLQKANETKKKKNHPMIYLSSLLFPRRFDHGYFGQ